jgi:hypothetical protein
MEDNKHNKDDPIIIHFEKRFNKIEQRLAKLEGEMKVILIVLSAILGGIIAIFIKV